MKYLYKIAVTLSILIIFSMQLSAQSNCKNYHLKKCGGYGPPYKYSGQSRSANLELEETSSFRMSAFAGFEYCVTLCADKQLKGIFFRIIEDTPEKTVLYDGSTDDSGMLQKEFSIETSKKLLIEVSVPASEKDAEDMSYNKTNGCVGVVIEYDKTGKKGFE